MVFKLIQDEIKALVQLQNRPLPADFTHSAAIQTSEDTSKDSLLPLMAGDCALTTRAPSDSDSLAAPAALSPFGSPSPPHRPDGADERAATGLSSGYGTLSAWESGETQEPRWSRDARAVPAARDPAKSRDEAEPSAARQRTTSGWAKPSLKKNK